MSNDNTKPTPQEEFKFLYDEIGFEQKSFWSRFAGFATLHAGLLVFITSDTVKNPQFLSVCALLLALLWLYVQWSSRFYVNRYKEQYHNLRNALGYPHLTHPVYSKPFFSPTDIAIVVPVALFFLWLQESSIYCFGFDIFQYVYPHIMSTQLLNAIGLFLNICGVILLFFYGFPQPSLEEGISLGIAGPQVEEHNRQVKELKKRYVCLSRLALSLVVLGFVLQFWAVLK